MSQQSPLTRDNTAERNADNAKLMKAEEKIRRIKNNEMSSNQPEKIRERFDDTRQKNLNAMKTSRELDKRNSIEEKKHLIWDNNCKDTILRKSIEKDKQDAKRNAQRNSSCFVFGSSTPRSINLDNITTLGPLPFRQYQTSMLSATPTSLYESNGDDNIRRRPHSMIYTTENTAESNFSYEYTPFQRTQAINSALRSEQAKACLTMSSIPEINNHHHQSDLNINNGYNDNLNSKYDDTDDGQNLMTQSLVLLPTSGRRRHPELMPVMPKEKDFLSSLVKDFSIQKVNTGPKRAISMTRLDQLAKPRQRYLEETLRARNAGNYSTNHLNNGSSNSNCMVRSMYNLPTRPLSTGPKTPIPTTTMRKGMSTSMTQLNDQNINDSNSRNSNHSNSKHRKNKASANVRKFSSNKTPDACQRDIYSNTVNSHFNEHTKQISRSLVQLNVDKPTYTPKETRTSKLRALKQGILSVDCPASKDGQLSALSRPISSLSGASEASTPSSSVIMRPKTARKPRPVSIAACASTRQNDVTPIRESRIDERRQILTSTPAQRPNRARSAGSSSSKRVPLSSNDAANSAPKPPPPRKPAHVKAAAAARKTLKQQQQQSPAEEKNVRNESIEKPVNILDEPNDELGKLNEENADNLLIQLDDEKKVENQENFESTNELKDANINQNESNAEAVNIEVNDKVSDDEVINENDSKIASTMNTSMSNGNVFNGNEDNQVANEENASINKKDMSVDEYKRVLAEKRRQAREQAEREAELERQRIEQLQREEEERERLLEEESRRLAEEHRRIEEEKLRKAIEEQQLREEEERKRKEIELKQKQEKEEQDAKAREEAEKARIELEERLRKDEEERLLRKKRVEAIMIRTRKGKETSPNSEGSRSPDLNSNDSPTKGVLVNHKIFVEN